MLHPHFPSGIPVVPPTSQPFEPRRAALREFEAGGGCVEAPDGQRGSDDQAEDDG